MTGFIAVISNMGLSVNHVYLNTGIPSLLDTYWFRSMFSKNRLQNKSFFHITNNDIHNRDDPNYSPLAKFQSIVYSFNRHSGNHYKPTQNSGIDDSFLPTKGRSSIIQYIPSKAPNFGVKLWVFAETVTGYIVHQKVYKREAA